MKQIRRRFSREFKLEAVRRLTKGRRLADVASELGVDAQVMLRWVDQVRVDPATAFPGNGRAPREEAELLRFAVAIFPTASSRSLWKI